MPYVFVIEATTTSSAVHCNMILKVVLMFRARIIKLFFPFPLLFSLTFLSPSPSGFLFISLFFPLYLLPHLFSLICFCFLLEKQFVGVLFDRKIELGKELGSCEFDTNNVRIAYCSLHKRSIWLLWAWFYFIKQCPKCLIGIAYCKLEI